MTGIELRLALAQLVVDACDKHNIEPSRIMDEVIYSLSYIDIGPEEVAERAEEMELEGAVDYFEQTYGSMDA